MKRGYVTDSALESEVVTHKWASETETCSSQSSIAHQVRASYFSTPRPAAQGVEQHWRASTSLPRRSPLSFGTSHSATGPCLFLGCMYSADEYTVQAIILTVGEHG
ncbi:hypothetical protein J6590_063212 [Homalodisca vitripennis]|nr:hypothetical protein J6590_063212 [Homalodisca vitripennis]